MVVPFLLARPRESDRARMGQRLHNVYCSLRPLSDNAITRYMKSRIFQEGPAAGEVVRSMRRQQGLMQLFHDYCESDGTTCEACGFLSAVEAGTTDEASNIQQECAGNGARQECAGNGARRHGVPRAQRPTSNVQVLMIVRRRALGRWAFDVHPSQ